MSIVLNLGVADVPYNVEGTTSGDVAQHLENRYHVMETFYNLNADKIAEDISKSITGAINSVVNGADPKTHDVFGSATSKIEHRLKEFISSGEAERVLPGLPSKAAKEGRSSRFKAGRNFKFRKKTKKELATPRTSLIDTGLYESTIKVWVKVK